MLHALFSLVLIIATQAAAPAPQSPATPPGQSGVIYRVGASDVLAIKVFNEEPLNNNYTVDSDGSITFPLIGRVQVAGLTTREIEEHLTKRLDGDYLKRPQVSVEIANYRSRSIFVMGEVKSPGRYQINGPQTLLEVLAHAGSTTPTASDTIIVQRYKDGMAAAVAAPALPGDAQSVEVFRVSLTELREGRLSANILLQDSDTIIVPPAERFYVTGFVRTPGAFVLRPGLTIRQAIAEAGGITERGSIARHQDHPQAEGRQGSRARRGHVGSRHAERHDSHPSTPDLARVRLAASSVFCPAFGGAFIVKLIIEPGRGAANYWGDVWRYRELLYFLTWRDIAVRYKQTAIGVAWALLRPAITMTVFVLFRRLMGTPAAGVPEPVLVFAAVLPWQFFSSALAESSMSLVGNASLVSKVYFPRLLVPAAAVTAAFADFLITLALLAGLMAWYGVAPGWPVLFLPAFVLLAAALAFGAGLCLSALNVEYRDFRYLVPFIIQVALFVSPIAFLTANVPERWHSLYMLNPLVGVIDGFRWSILGEAFPVDGRALATAIGTAFLSLMLGVWYFRRVERRFADVI